MKIDYNREDNVLFVDFKMKPKKKPQTSGQLVFPNFKQHERIISLEDDSSTLPDSNNVEQ